MKRFGQIKTKLVAKLADAYGKENKAEIKNTLALIKENKEFKEMYLFYEEIENKYFDDKEIAKLYVEGLNTYFTNSDVNLKNLEIFCESLDKQIGEIENETNKLYESLDILSEKDSLTNIEKKVIAKKNLIEHLTNKKEIAESKETTLVPNETLLNAVLTNNFNTLYSNTLSESQKEELKNLINLSHDEITTKTNELKESITNQVNTLISESKDSDLTTKLNKVKEEVSGMSPSRYNFYRLNELKNGLN